MVDMDKIALQAAQVKFSVERNSQQDSGCEPFAHGALRAAQWLAKQKPGLYGMQDVLEL